MKKLIYNIILAGFTLSVSAAYKDVTGAAVETNGCVIQLYFSGLGTNGLLFPSFGTNNIPSNVCYVTLISMGFDTNATAVTRTRTNQLDKVLRRPYPDNAILDIMATGDGCVARVWMSDPVFARDSNIVLYANAGFFAVTNGTGTNCNAVVALSVTNGSVIPYPFVGISPAIPDRRNATGLLLTNRAVAFGWVPENSDYGHPVACVSFSTTDESSHTVSNNIPVMTPIWMGNGKTTAVYQCYQYLTNFGTTNMLFTTETAWPWIGDTGYSTGATNANNFPILIAVVSPQGTNTNLGVSATDDPTALDATRQFLTIAGAAVFLQASNNAWNSRNNLSACKIYVKSGVHDWTGGTATISRNHCRVTVLPYPGDILLITNRATTQDLGDMMEIQRARLAIDGAVTPFSSTDYLWLNDCTNISQGTAIIQNCTNVWITGGSCPGAVQGYGPFAGQGSMYYLFGVNFDGNTKTHYPAVMIGCKQSRTNGAAFATSFASATKVPFHPIVYNNSLLGFNGGATGYGIGVSHGLTNGCSFVQNELGYYTNNNTPALLFIASQNDLAYTNVYFMNNTLVGKRAGFFYNDSGSVPAYKDICMGRNNVVDVPGFKTDLHPDPAEDGARIGNWAVMNGVSWSGNCFIHCNSDQASGSYMQDFPGINTYSPAPLGTNIMNYADYVERLAWPDGMAGGGNYAPSNTSSVLVAGLINTTKYLPYDINGNSRGTYDAIGASTYVEVESGEPEGEAEVPFPALTNLITPIIVFPGVRTNQIQMIPVR